MMKTVSSEGADVLRVTLTTGIVAAALFCGIAIGQGSTATAAPGASTESWGEFVPSDSPPRCLPKGTVTYESYDAEAGVHLWVFRWPDGSYQAVPRLAVGAAGQVVPYSPPRISPDPDDATSTTGSVDAERSDADGIEND